MNPGINRWQAVTSNTSYAWFSGGQPTASTVQRIDFGFIKLHIYPYKLNYQLRVHKLISFHKNHQGFL